MTMPSAKQHPQLQYPTTADWSALRPTITKLYGDERWTMDQLRLHLVEMGYRVNKRMVRGRITQWNLHRNHQLKDMVAALQLLSPDIGQWPSPTPSFLIRGRVITMEEVKLYFRRKKIQNPFELAHSMDPTDNGSHVQLLNGEMGLKGKPEVCVGTSSFVSYNSSPKVGPKSLPQCLRGTDENAVSSLQLYCLAYLAQESDHHKEPQVHQFTIQGRFGELMRDGLAHMMRHTPEAFLYFRRGFKLVESLLCNCHPMAIAQYLAVVCIFAVNGAQSVLQALRRHVASMASTLNLPPPAREVLAAISSSRDVLCTAIVCLRAAVGKFTEEKPTSWQNFYLKEMLCDCLYYAGSHDEGGAQRALLLQQQEDFYGPNARNVICTLMRVASNDLNQGALEIAQARYGEALERAGNLIDLGRAKVRYLALEGLADVELARFEVNHRQNDSIRHVLQAYDYLDAALRDAETWFEQSNRRMIRAMERRAQIKDLLIDMGHKLP